MRKQVLILRLDSKKQNSRCGKRDYPLPSLVFFFNTRTHCADTPASLAISLTLMLQSMSSGAISILRRGDWRVCGALTVALPLLFLLR